MKTASLKQIKDELKELSPSAIMELCLRMARFKKENKELLTYLLLYEGREDSFIEAVKAQIDEDLEQINTATYYWMKKTIRKTLRNAKKYIRYSKNKKTEGEILLHFCNCLLEIKPSIQGNDVLWNIYTRTLDQVRKAVNSLHEDLQYDFYKEIDQMPH